MGDDGTDGPIFSKNEFAAAQMVIARLHCETEGREFYPHELGITWLHNDVPCAQLEDGSLLLFSELIEAAVTLTWSLLVEQAIMLDEEEIGPAVTRLALGLANTDPSY